MLTPAFLDQVRAAIQSSEHVWDAYIDRKWVQQYLDKAAATAEVDILLLRIAGFGIWLREQVV